MSVIKNFDLLASTELRKKALLLVEAAFTSIQPKQVLQESVSYAENTLIIQGRRFNIKNFERVFLVGFGKGSSGIVKYLENLLEDVITEGWDIDVVDETFKKIHYTKGTHPLPTQANIDFTQNVLDGLKNVTEKDLVIVVICGGGSVLFESSTVSLEEVSHINDVLLKSGATISDMNVIRKHISKVKGGKFAKYLYPAKVVSLIFSDVPGNDLSVIASGPTVKDATTQRDLDAVEEKYHFKKTLTIPDDAFTPTVSEQKYFENVFNILIVSNQMALAAMEKKAKELGLVAQIFTDRLQGNAKELGKKLIDETKSGEVLLAGGESTMKVVGSGKGGRNQALTLASLPFVKHDTIIVAFDSDGMDYTGFAGAIGDSETIEKAQKLGLSQQEYLDNDDSYTFFEKVGDGIDTGKLESNVSDLYIVIKG